MNKVERLEDLCETAWTLIANAYGGDWELANQDWQDAAWRWRNRWHQTLPHSKSKHTEEKTDEKI